MKHLYNTTVYDTPENLARLASLVGVEGMYIDGLELLTSYGPACLNVADCVTSVHLPYATDWYGPITGLRPSAPGLDVNTLRYRHYGRDKEGMVDALRLAIDSAAVLDPVYGVIHASSGNMDELFTPTFSDPDDKVVLRLTEVLNDVVAHYPDGEPPFTLVLENTWWPGLRLNDNDVYGLIEENIEFTDWGVNLDTGHLLVTSRRSTDEETALRILNGYVDDFCDGLMDRIFVTHLHLNTTAALLNSGRYVDDPSLSYDEREAMIFPYVLSIDTHTHFTDPAVKDLVARIDPDFVVHEISQISISDHIRDHICQASLLEP